jgi:UDP-glucose 4-epimerase
MRVLVTGAAGYIGSVVTEQLIEHGFEVLALDNLQHGNAAAVDPRARFTQGDLLDGPWLTRFLEANPIDAVVHLAAEALIDESLRDPGRFFRANVCAGLNLLEAMVAGRVDRIVFSSTAAVYGEPAEIPITEDAPCVPVNSYGESKLAFERMLGWYRKAYGIKYVCLRYFNACGASTNYGEYHVPETHLIPTLLDACDGRRDSFVLYGTDYDTNDGTCIRDYVHVIDIAEAHLLSLEKMDSIGGEHYNIGSGTGYSNGEIIAAARRATGREIPIVTAGRRPGDPARLVADIERIRCELGWQPRHSDLDAVIDSAWRWRKAHPNGYTM